jgi:CubicO group peptidase (beta-lactamase class C family)
MRPTFALAALLTACLALPAPAAAQTPGAEYFPRAEWRTSRPKKQSLDGRILSRLVRRIGEREDWRLHSLQIVRNGYLVVDEYFNGWSADRVHTLQSDTKSVTSLLVGIAVDRGEIGSVDDRVLDYFPEYRNIRNRDERKEAMRLRDLLTMRTGLDWSEANYETSPLRELNESREDWLKFVLDWPMREQPGTRFEYNSGGVILLGGVVRNTSGIPLDRFARENLFEPLGIEDVQWYFGPDGVPHTGGGLSLKPRDMARIGYLVLRNGRWRDRQIVSEAWLRESLARSVSPPWSFGGRPADYGYLWWLLPDDDEYVITASGARSQWIFVVPKHDLVVVVTGDAPDYTGFSAPVRFLYDEILRAVR